MTPPKHSFICSALATLSFTCTAQVQTLAIEDYLAKMNIAEVTFSGRIRYNDSSSSASPFTFYNKDGEPFAATIDAGRKARERIQNDCELSGFMISMKNMCKIEGMGTVEIKGSRILLSIDSISKLLKP